MCASRGDPVPKGSHTEPTIVDVVRHNRDLPCDAHMAAPLQWLPGRVHFSNLEFCSGRSAHTHACWFAQSFDAARLAVAALCIRGRSGSCWSWTPTLTGSLLFLLQEMGVLSSTRMCDLVLPPLNLIQRAIPFGARNGNPNGVANAGIPSGTDINSSTSFLQEIMDWELASVDFQ